MTSTLDRPLTASRGTDRSRLARFAREVGALRVPLFLLVLLVVLMSATQPAFLTGQNLTNAISSVAVLWFVALGATLVLLTGGIDLSSGAVAALSGVVLVKALDAGVPFLPAVLLTVAAGGLVGGLLNGVLVGHLRLNVFVVTLASMISITGAVSLWTSTQSFYVDDSSLVWLVSGEIAGIPAIILLMGITLVLFLLVQRWTYFGRDVYAVGSSPLAAELSGIRRGGVLVLVYGIAGGCAALGGIVAVGRVGAATPQVDSNLPLQAIAAILIGGTSLVGGVGGVGGTAVGVAFMGVLQNGLSISGVQSFWQQVLTGVVLIVAVLGDRFSGALTLRGRRRTREAPDPADPTATAGIAERT